MWCVGVLYFILLTNRMMFIEQPDDSYKKTEWTLELDRHPFQNCMHVSVEGLKFLDDVVRYEFS